MKITFTEEIKQSLLDFLTVQKWLAEELRIPAGLQGHPEALNSTEEIVQFWAARSTVVGYMRFVESSIYSMKQVILSVREEELSELVTHAELFALQGKKAFINNKGEIDIKDEYFRVLDDVVFTFLMFSKVFSADFKIDKSDEGWRAFRELVNIRNRITHPKGTDSLMVSGTDLGVCMTAEKWFEKTQGDLIVAAGKTYDFFL